MEIDFPSRPRFSCPSTIASRYVVPRYLRFSRRPAGRSTGGRGNASAQWTFHVKTRFAIWGAVAGLIGGVFLMLFSIAFRPTREGIAGVVIAGTVMGGMLGGIVGFFLGSFLSDKE